MLLAQLKEKAALQLKVHGHKLDNLEVASKGKIKRESRGIINNILTHHQKPEIVKKLTEVGVLEDQISELSQRGNSGCVYVDGNNRVGLGEADVYPVWAEVYIHLLIYFFVIFFLTIADNFFFVFFFCFFVFFRLRIHKLNTKLGIVSAKKLKERKSMENT